MTVNEVRHASDLFYDALNHFITGDTNELFNVCSHADDVTAMHPLGGRQIGWSQVRPIWEMAASSNSGGSVKADDLQVTLLGDDAAYTIGTETVSAIVGGTPISFSGRCTNVYRREDGHWKLVHHHVDFLPDVAAAFQNAATQAD